MTIINPNSIAGITSLTAEADVMNFYKSDGTFGSLQLNGCNFNTTNGISTFNNLVVGGTLTYEDVKNVDSVGIITARGGLNVTANTDTDTLNVSGVSTFSSIVLSNDNAIHFMGTTADDADAILRQSAGGGQLLINSRNDTILNIDSNNDGTDAHFAVAHGAMTGSSTELFRVQEDGKIGIGDNSPDRTLHVNSGSSNECALFESTDTEVTLEFKDTTGTASLKCRNDFRLNNSTGELLRIDSSGRLLIGTTTEGEASADDLTIANTGHAGLTIRSGTSNWGSFFFSDGTSGGAEYDGAIEYKHGSSSDNYMRFRTAQIERLRIHSNGNVTIGSGTFDTGNFGSVQGLNVYGTQPLVLVNATGNGTSFFMGKTSSTCYFGTSDAQNINFRVSDLDKMILDASGRLLLGTTTEGEASADNLTIADSAHAGITIRSGGTSYGSLFFSDATSGSGEYSGSIEYKHGDNFLILRTAATEKVRITSTGRVGINQASPGCVLDVLNTTDQLVAKFLSTHNTLGGGVQIKNNNANGGVEFLNKSGTNVAALYHSTGGWTWNQNLQILGSAGLRIGTTSGYGNADLFVDTDTTTNGDHIAQFKGRTSGSNGAGLGFVHLTCGSDDDRTGIQWEHQNVSNERMWFGDDKRLYLKNGNPTESTAQGRYLLTVAAGVPDFPSGSSYDNAAKSALEIKKHYPASQNGNYWIFDHNNVPRQIYCEMEIDGGGWMLWNDYNNGQTSMNEALGGSSTSPNSGLARGNWNNYAYYQVLIRASDIDSTGERLHSIVQLDGSGNLKYCADYGCDFFMEDVGDPFDPTQTQYFMSGSSSEYIKIDGAYDPQLGASGWQTFSGGGWQVVYIREMDSRMSPGMHRSCHLVERIYGYDDNGVPIWSQADSMNCLPYWTDISLGGEVADGTNDFMMEHGRKIVANNGNSGAMAQGRMFGVLTGQFEVEVKLGYSWGWSQAIATSTIQIAENMRDALSQPYAIGTNTYYYAGIYNNSSNNKWMPVVNSPYGGYTEFQRSGGAGTSISHYIWRTSDGTILCRRSDNTHGTINLGIPYAGPLIITSGRQSPMMTEIVGVWDSKRTDQLGSRSRWYK